MFMNAYSPLLDDFNFYDDTDTYDGGDQDHDVYHLSVDFDGTPRTLTTDSFTLNVYTEQAVGQTEDVASGEKAQVTLEGLEPENAVLLVCTGIVGGNRCTAFRTVSLCYRNGA